MRFEVRAEAAGASRAGSRRMREGALVVQLAAPPGGRRGERRARGDPGGGAGLWRGGRSSLVRGDTSRTKTVEVRGLAAERGGGRGSRARCAEAAAAGALRASFALAMGAALHVREVRGARQRLHRRRGRRSDAASSPPSSAASLCDRRFGVGARRRPARAPVARARVRRAHARDQRRRIHPGDVRQRRALRRAARRARARHDARDRARRDRRRACARARSTTGRRHGHGRHGRRHACWASAPSTSRAARSSSRWPTRATRTPSSSAPSPAATSSTSARASPRTPPSRAARTSSSRASASGGIDLVVWERGVGITLACGTGRVRDGRRRLQQGASRRAAGPCACTCPAACSTSRSATTTARP